jgi:ADP-ribosylglycohydrolase
MACIAGAIAEAFYGGVPSQIAEQVLARLDDRLRNTVHAFQDSFDLPVVAPG